MPLIDHLVIEFDNPVDLPPDVMIDKKLLRDGLAALLYHRGLISPKQALAMTGLPRRDFEDRLANFGYTILDERDFADEIAAAEQLSGAKRHS